MTPLTHQLDSQLDLVFERIVDVSPELVWAAWTTPEHLKHWFTPAPWKTIDCEIDLRPGGLFRTGVIEASVSPGAIRAKPKLETV